MLRKYMKLAAVNDFVRDHRSEILWSKRHEGFTTVKSTNNETDGESEEYSDYESSCDDGEFY